MYPSLKCGSHHVGIVDYGFRSNASEKWDAYCYRVQGEKVRLDQYELKPGIPQVWLDGDIEASECPKLNRGWNREVKLSGMEALLPEADLHAKIMAYGSLHHLFLLSPLFQMCSVSVGMGLWEMATHAQGVLWQCWPRRQISQSTIL